MFAAQLNARAEISKILETKINVSSLSVETLADAEKQKLTTVRLHTGEPSIYGAVREQMDLLDEKGISYESCPGVSACFGAAALLNLEYTLPEVSQSLIITRMEGRTKVPERESIESFAAHHASMAIYLSTGMIGELGRRLIAGGYGKDTPAAIVYKATWPEEEAYLCTVELSDLKEGNTISAYVDEAMTLSLPPITNGLLILVQAEGYDFPRYTKVKELMAANTEGERILTAENGINYTITAETRLLPYLTRNIVSEETVLPHAHCLLR